MAKDITVDKLGNRYVVKLGGFAVAEFAELSLAETRKKDLERAIIIDAASKISASTLRHVTGWEYTGQISLSPELFVDDDETKKTFLVKIENIEPKLEITAVVSNG